MILAINTTEVATTEKNVTYALQASDYRFFTPVDTDG
jgi:hypothetical protein